MILSNTEKSVFHETRETVTRLKEPLKMTIKAFKDGHRIELSANTSAFEIDPLEKDLTDLILMGRKIIEGPMQSKYLGVNK